MRVSVKPDFDDFTKLDDKGAAVVALAEALRYMRVPEQQQYQLAKLLLRLHRNSPTETFEEIAARTASTALTTAMKVKIGSRGGLDNHALSALDSRLVYYFPDIRLNSVMAAESLTLASIQESLQGNPTIPSAISAYLARRLTEARVVS